VIEVRDLTKRYGQVEALRGVSFSVPRGQVVGLLGPNGAGKTTAMRILTGFVAPTSGSALVDGREVFEEPIAAQSKIGYLPEGNPLYLELRLVEALRFAAEMYGLLGAARDAAVQESIRLAGLEGMGRRLIGTLSKGYRQRTGLAQALLHKPPILILDEPTSGLDPNQQEEMRALIRNLGADRTVLLSTHILPEVEAVCDRALIIAKGKLVADGTIDEIKSRGMGGSVATVTVRASPETAASAFRALDFAADVQAAPLAEDAGVVRVRIRFEGAASSERLERIAAAAVAKGLPLSGLAAETASLERIFAELTTSREEAEAEIEGAATDAGSV
jgi:ABC-2 type transport system ATP-binding protein